MNLFNETVLSLDFHDPVEDDQRLTEPSFSKSQKTPFNY